MQHLGMHVCKCNKLIDNVLYQYIMQVVSYETFIYNSLPGCPGRLLYINLIISEIIFNGTTL